MIEAKAEVLWHALHFETHIEIDALFFLKLVNKIILDYVFKQDLLFKSFLIEFQFYIFYLILNCIMVLPLSSSRLCNCLLILI